MVNKKAKCIEESDVPYRRRGRPAGKNRVPLSQEERRARNAQYERERRNETAEVMSQLMEAVNCDPSISNAELLATVINRIQRASRNKSEDISEIERINANLEAQIATLQSRLGLDDASFALLDSENNDQEILMSQSSTDAETYNKKGSKKRKRSERSSSEYSHQEKRTKTRSETLSVDSGIEGMSHTISPPPAAEQPLEIYEESHANAELQSELYNEIYNSETKYSQSMPEWNAALSHPCMESLSRSLIVVPPIRVPQQDSPVVSVEQNTQPELTSLQNVEPPCDLNETNVCDFLPQHDTLPTLDFLTDADKCLLTDWIGADCLETNEFNNDAQMQVSNYPIDNLPGFG